MDESFKKDLADLAKLTPNRARQDYWNEIYGLLMCTDPAVSGPVSKELFWKRLKEWADNGKGYIMSTFSARFPADRYPGIIDSQPTGTAARFDEIAAEINGLYISGQLTRENLDAAAEEMRKLCYE